MAKYTVNCWRCKKKCFLKTNEGLIECDNCGFLLKFDKHIIKTIIKKENGISNNELNNYYKFLNNLRNEKIFQNKIDSEKICCKIINLFMELNIDNYKHLNNSQPNCDLISYDKKECIEVVTDFDPQRVNGYISLYDNFFNKHSKIEKEKSIKTKKLIIFSPSFDPYFNFQEDKSINSDILNLEEIVTENNFKYIIEKIINENKVFEKIFIIFLNPSLGTNSCLKDDQYNGLWKLAHNNKAKIPFEVFEIYNIKNKKNIIKEIDPFNLRRIYKNLYEDYNILVKQKIIELNIQW